MSGAVRRASCSPSQRVVKRPPSGSGPVLRREVRLDLRVVEHEPGSEAPDVAIREPRPVVELEHRALVRHGIPVEAAGHAQVDEEAEAALEP